ncbi:MAG TPA: LysM domain-containing protein, partial [Candidatus Limnocylindrales bacterium]
PTATPRPVPTPRPTPAGAAGTASASRLAVLRPCAGQAGCYVYSVRAGDNLFSIAHWFGVPLSSIYAMNPTVQRSGIHPGMQLRIPTPTR